MGFRSACDIHNDADEQLISDRKAGPLTKRGLLKIKGHPEPL